MLGSILKAVRPHQWVKNIFVAAPVVFAKRIGDPALGSAGRRRRSPRSACCRSAVYLVNDLVDIEKDRDHPTKRHRPIASGKLKPQFARALAGLFAVAALGSGLALGWGFALTAAGYLALNVAYSFRLKRIAFVDVGCISVGFLLRVLAGAFAIAVPAVALAAALHAAAVRAARVRQARARAAHRRRRRPQAPRGARRLRPDVLRVLLLGPRRRDDARLLRLHPHAAHQRALRRRTTGVHGAVRRLRRLPLHPHRQPDRHRRQPHRLDAPRSSPSS